MSRSLRIFSVLTCVAVLAGSQLAWSGGARDRGGDTGLVFDTGTTALKFPRSPKGAQPPGSPGSPVDPIEAGIDVFPSCGSFEVVINGMEAQLFKKPVVENMETNPGVEPFSIPAFVNEYPFGLFGEDTGTLPTTGIGAATDGLNVATGAAFTSPDTVWTTVEGLASEVTEPRWRCQQQAYSNITVATAANMLTAFDAMWLKCKFEAPGTRNEYFENDNLYNQFIACSRLGQTEYTRQLRDSQDTLVTSSRQDPAFVTPQYAGIDLVYVTELDTAVIYPDPSANVFVTETGDTGAGTRVGPRFYWLNAGYVSPVFHTSRYMYKHPVMTHPNQPFTHVAPCDTWYNNVARSRQRCGIIYPDGDLF